ncbi:MAG: hypothetical protein II671_06150, partial [Salinivirgaceae bacterium]|nr:hypothetical protein [Salinivirgaceae bacterium]
ISLSADYIQAITQVSGKQDKLEFTYDNSGSIIKINARHNLNLRESAFQNVEPRALGAVKVQWLNRFEMQNLFCHNQSLIGQM